MRCFDNGTFYTVKVSAREVDEFNRRWPCSTLDGPQSFEFDKCNGDLVDRSGEGDGPEAVAMSKDAQMYGKRKLRIGTPENGWLVGWQEENRAELEACDEPDEIATDEERSYGPRR